jgi:hypothetical protein
MDFPNTSPSSLPNTHVTATSLSTDAESLSSFTTDESASFLSNSSLSSVSPSTSALLSSTASSTRTLVPKRAEQVVVETQTAQIRRQPIAPRKTSVDVNDTLKNELKTELQTRLNPDRNENKGSTMVNGRLLLRKIEMELKDEIGELKTPNGFSGVDSIEKAAVPSPSLRTTPITEPNPRTRKFSYDSRAFSKAQSPSFNLLKETLDNRLTQKDALIHDSVAKKSSVRRCSLNVTLGNLEKAEIITSPASTTTTTTNANKDTIHEVDENEPHLVKDENLYRFRTAPRSHSLIDDRLMISPASFKAAYYLSRASVDFGNDRIHLNEDEEEEDENETSN